MIRGKFMIGLFAVLMARVTTSTKEFFNLVKGA